MVSNGEGPRGAPGGPQVPKAETFIKIVISPGDPLGGARRVVPTAPAQQSVPLQLRHIAFLSQNQSTQLPVSLTPGFLHKANY